MRTAAKVFVIIGMIFGCWLIFPLIIGLCALGQINNEFEKPSTAMSVVTLIFCSLLGGIFMLCIEDVTPKRRVPPGKICEQCGKYNITIQDCIINSYLGPVVKKLCPDCKQKLNSMQPNSKSMISPSHGKQCVKCGSYNLRVREYKVKTPLGYLNLNLCIDCKEKCDNLEQDQEQKS